MINRLIDRAQGFTPLWTWRAALGTLSLRGTMDAAAGLARHAFALLGVGAIAGWALVFFKPEITDHLKPLSPFTKPVEPVAAPAVAAPPLTRLMEAPSQEFVHANFEQKADAVLLTDDDAARMSGTAAQRQRVTQWLSRRYRVAHVAVDMLVSASYMTAQDIKLDPLLILSVVAIESRFNPFAESPMGAQGLMQVMSKVHHDKFKQLGGLKAALNPVANMRVGSTILKEYIRRTGSVEEGLRLYVGASDWENEGGYGARVLAEYQRLKDVAAGKRVPITAGAGTIAAKTAPAPATAPENKVELPSEAEASGNLMNDANRTAAL